MAIDRCTNTTPHPAHRTQYGPFGVKDCPGVADHTPADALGVLDTVLHRDENGFTATFSPAETQALTNAAEQVADELAGVDDNGSHLRSALGKLRSHQTADAAPYDAGDAPTARSMPATRTEWTWRHNNYTSTASATTDRAAAERSVTRRRTTSTGETVTLMRRTVTDWTPADDHDAAGDTSTTSRPLPIHDDLHRITQERDHLAGLLARIGDTISPTGERPEEALGTLVADVEALVEQRDQAVDDVTRLKTHLVNEQARLRGHLLRVRNERDDLSAELERVKPLADYHQGMLTAVCGERDKALAELAHAGQVLTDWRQSFKGEPANEADRVLVDLIDGGLLPTADRPMPPVAAVLGSAPDRAHVWAEPTYLIRWPHCSTCGLIRRHDDQHGPCKGPARVTLRKQKQGPDDLARWIRRAVADPGSIAGRRLGPTWPHAEEGYADEQESTTDWITRAVLRVLAVDGRPRCERCEQVIGVDDAYEPPLPGVGLWEHAGRCP